MKTNALAEFINEVVNEARIRESEVQLSTGRRVQFGSDAHITDLERRIRDLASHRDRQPRGSSARSDFSRAINRMKNELRSATNARDKSNRV
jgi:hypothetical protein